MINAFLLMLSIFIPTWGLANQDLAEASNNNDGRNACYQKFSQCTNECTWGLDVRRNPFGIQIQTYNQRQQQCNISYAQCIKAVTDAEKFRALVVAGIRLLDSDSGIDGSDDQRQGSDR